MSIFDDDDERRSRSLAEALTTSMLRDVLPFVPAWSGPPNNADLITQAIADDLVGSKPHWLSLGYGTDMTTAPSQDLFSEMLRRVQESEG